MNFFLVAYDYVYLYLAVRYYSASRFPAQIHLISAIYYINAGIKKCLIVLGPLNNFLSRRGLRYKITYISALHSLAENTRFPSILGDISGSPRPFRLVFCPRASPSGRKRV